MLTVLALSAFLPLEILFPTGSTEIQGECLTLQGQDESDMVLGTRRRLHGRILQGSVHFPSAWVGVKYV